jgi:hypothetical protein
MGVRVAEVQPAWLGAWLNERLPDALTAVVSLETLSLPALSAFVLGPAAGPNAQQLPEDLDVWTRMRELAMKAARAAMEQLDTIAHAARGLEREAGLNRHGVPLVHPLSHTKFDCH